MHAFLSNMHVVTAWPLTALVQIIMFTKYSAFTVKQFRQISYDAGAVKSTFVKNITLLNVSLIVTEWKFTCKLPHTVKLTGSLIQGSPLGLPVLIFAYYCMIEYSKLIAKIIVRASYLRFCYFAWTTCHTVIRIIQNRETWGKPWY